MSLKLQGVLGPVVTTFLGSTGELDRTAFSENIRAHMVAGLAGVVVAGSTGEAALLDERERAALVEAAREVVPSNKLLIVGTGAESTRTCIRFTKHAAQRGADAVLVVAPHYYGGAMTAAALRAHYWRVADESPVPVVLYNIPKFMHFALAPQLVTDLAGHGNVIGIKDSSGDLDLLTCYVNAQSERFSVLTGNAQTFAAALTAGARGAVLAAGLFAPTIVLSIWESAQMGDARGAAEMQQRLTPLGKRIVGELGIPAVKAALDRVGLHGGPVRSPLLPLAPAEEGEVATLLREAELAFTA